MREDVEAFAAGAGISKLIPEGRSSTATVSPFVPRLQKGETSMPPAER